MLRHLQGCLEFGVGVAVGFGSGAQGNAGGGEGGKGERGKGGKGNSTST